MSFIETDIDNARKILISNQLNFTGHKKTFNNLLYGIIEKLSYVQIDTISVVERSHHHILWSRMNDYDKRTLDDLLEKDKLIFEYWAHAASYLPMKDYRFSLLRKDAFRKKHKEWGSANRKIIKRVYDRIKSDGPMQSRNFIDKKKPGKGWWDWKPSKDALDFLFHSGKLMVCRRSGFQKVFDITERVLPGNVNSSYPSEKEVFTNLILNSLNANGFSEEREIMYLRKYDRKLFTKVINELKEDKKIIDFKIKEMKDSDYYVQTNRVEDLIPKNMTDELYVLSPFDNLIIDRRKIRNLFGFDFQLECYLPGHKRKFGYFCLPVLYKNKFIGRIDLKADRKSKILFIQNIFFENHHKKSNSFNKILMKKLNLFAGFCGCESVNKLI